MAERQPVVDVASAQRSVRASSKPAEVAGSVRYVLGDPVTVRRGGSTMVSILNKPIAAEDAFLFRPDANAPGSDRHPFRAVRLANDSGFTLEPGPIAIFARGTFVGDSLISRLDVGETAWIPYALEGGTTVTVATDAAEGLALNEIGRVRLRLGHPIFADPYSANRATGSFVLIDQHSNDTVAAGIVRDA